MNLVEEMGKNPVKENEILKLGKKTNDYIMKKKKRRIRRNKFPYSSFIILPTTSLLLQNIAYKF